jgi:lysyl endopeptidase
MNKHFNITVFLLCYCLFAQAESVDPVQDNRIISQSSAAARFFLGTDSNPFNLSLPNVNPDLTPNIPGVQKTGVVYQLPVPVLSSELNWEPVNGGYVARIHLYSVQAKRLRFHLTFNQTAATIAFRLKGSEDTLPLEPIDQTFIHNHDIWLPITNGNNAELELFINDIAAKNGLFAVDSINILIEEPTSAIPDLIKEINKSAAVSSVTAQSLFLTQKPEFDLACWANVPQYPALQKAASGTAKINFISNGGSFICSGTLLNDSRSSLTPWFATARHCLTNQAIASTATFEWFFQATSCGGFFTDSRYSQTFGGAKLLWTNAKNDISFLRLNASPPGGVFYQGWDSKRLKVGNLVWGVHHPEGDHTMVSQGRVKNLSVNVKDEDSKVHVFNQIQYIYGATEGGSSGSGIFSVSKGLARWRGALFGSSTTISQTSFYSDFSVYYPKIKRWLVRQRKR